MRHLLLATVLIAIVPAMPAAAVVFGPPGGDCESSPDGCGGGGGPPPPPPSLPGTSGKSGDYRVAIDSSGTLRDGYVRGDETTYFGGGPYVPIGGNGTLIVGIGQSTAILKGTLDPEATAFASASADVHFSAQGGMRVAYLVELHALNAAAFSALQPLLGISGAIATVSGSYTLTQSGQSFSQASAQTGTGLPIDQALQAVSGSICDRSGYYSLDGAACGTTSYTLDLNFVSGSAFNNGNPYSIYGTVDLAAAAHAGRTGIDGYAGVASAFIDPTIILGGGINPNLYTLNIGNAITPYTGAVPEPAAWAFMLAGFAAIGVAARHKRMRTVAA